MGFEAKIAQHVSQKYPPKSDTYYAQSAAEDLGLPEAPGFFESIFRRNQVAQRIAKIEHHANAIKVADMAQLESMRETRQNEAIESALCRDGQLTSTTTGYRGWRKTEDLISPKIVKYLNAIKLELLSGKVKLSRPDEAEWKALRARIVKEDGHQCQVCEKSPREKHVHHIVPISKFGSNHPNNLITLCYSCHNKAHPEFKVSKNAP